LMDARSVLSGMSDSLSKIETAFTNPMFARVANIADRVKSTGAITGGKSVQDLYEIPANKANDVEYLKGRLEELKNAAVLSKEITTAQQESSQAPIIKKGW
jgi:hypothetical protein